MENGEEDEVAAVVAAVALLPVVVYEANGSDGEYCGILNPGGAPILVRVVVVPVVLGVVCIINRLLVLLLFVVVVVSSLL